MTEASNYLIPCIIPRSQHSISRSQIDTNALKVLYRLHNEGYQAYLVGGCVRDLLLGQQPKDFDVVTDALPDEIRQVFRNCRLIGRRFRLAHVHFKGQIIEVATFRGSGDGEDESDKVHAPGGMILRDNTYGTLEEDVFRRDVTVNGLYYNIADFSVVDYVGGMRDLEARRLRLIGDPERRYREDPVRMLRVVRIAAKLGFFIDRATMAPIVGMSQSLGEVPRARLFEEVNKLFLHGSSLHTYQLLRRFRLFEHLFPLTAQLIAADDPQPNTFLIQVFEDTDRRVEAGQPVIPSFLLAALLWHPVCRRTQELEQRSGLSPNDAFQRAAAKVVQEQSIHMALPRRFVEPLREIWNLQRRLEHHRGRRALRLLSHPRFRAAYDFLALRAQSGEVDPELTNWWHCLLEAPAKERTRLVNGPKASHRGRRRKRPQQPA